MRKIQIRNIIIPFLCVVLLICSLFYYFTYHGKASVKEQSVTYTDVGFDTVISFSCTCSSKEFDEYATIVKDTFSHYNELFDQYNEYEGVNNVYTINHEAYNNLVTVDADLIDCIQLAQKMYEIDPHFDISQGSLLNVWHTYREEGISLNNDDKDGNLPTEEEIKKAMENGGMDLIKISENTVELLNKDASIDLGGIAKGYASQKAKEALNEKGLTNGYINAGGNVVLLGPKADGSTWKIGIQDPDGNNSLLTYETDDSKAIVTSGDYQRYYTVDGIRYAHIVDPFTGYPATTCRSVTVIMDDSALADALSTTLFCLSLEDGQALVKKLQKTYDLQVIWVLDENSSDQTPDYSIDSYSVYATENALQHLTK